MHTTSTLFTILATLSLLAAPGAALPAPYRGDGAGAGAGGISAPFGGDRSGMSGFGDGANKGSFAAGGGASAAAAPPAMWGESGQKPGGQKDHSAWGSGVGSGFAKRQGDAASATGDKGCKAKSVGGATNYWTGGGGSGSGSGRWGQTGSGTSGSSGQQTQGQDQSVAPAPAPAPAPVPSSDAAPVPAPSADIAPVPAPIPTTDAAPVPAPAPVPSSQAAPVPSVQPATGGSAGGGGGAGDYAGVGPYTGEGTYYDAGLGACGITNTNSDDIVALSHTLWDSWPGATGNPNQNPICGRKIQINWGGKTATATVTDRCEGCALRDVDMTPTLFQKFAPLGLGRMGVNSEPLTWNWV